MPLEVRRTFGKAAQGNDPRARRPAITVVKRGRVGRGVSTRGRSRPRFRRIALVSFVRLDRFGVEANMRTHIFGFLGALCVPLAWPLTCAAQSSDSTSQHDWSGPYLGGNVEIGRAH